jgi:hypothetical protein
MEQGPAMEGRAMFAVLARSRAASAARPRPTNGAPAVETATAPTPAV